jgi:tRNA 2-thiocytidine biosynthesis protein TtcA
VGWPGRGDEGSERDGAEGAGHGGFRFRSKLERNIARRAGEAIVDFDLIRDGERIMVCLSGGKDSYALLDILLQLRRRAPVKFDLVAVNVDQGWPGYQADVVAGWLAQAGVEYHMERANFPPIMNRLLKPGATPCSVCSRLRRGVLYNVAPRLGCTAIALGHHLDDLCETLLLNIFYSGRIRAMPPRLVSDDQRNVVIRPLVYVREQEIREYATARGYPIVRCSGPTCGLPDQKRQVVKRVLSDLERDSPELKYQMLAAMFNVVPSHLLDRRLLARLAEAAGKGQGSGAAGGSDLLKAPEPDATLED